MDTENELLDLLAKELEKKGIKILERGMGTQEVGRIDLLAIQGGRLLLVGLFPDVEEALICRILNIFDWARQNLRNMSLLFKELDPSQSPGVVLVVSHLSSRIRTALSYLPSDGWQIYEYLLSDEGMMILKEAQIGSPPHSEVRGWRQEAELSLEELRELMDLHLGISKRFPNLLKPQINTDVHG